MIALILTLNLFVFSQNCNSLIPSNFTFLVVSNSNTLIVASDMSNEKNAIHCSVPSTWTNNIAGATWIWDTVTLPNTGNL